MAFWVLPKTFQDSSNLISNSGGAPFVLSLSLSQWESPPAVILAASLGLTAPVLSCSAAALSVPISADIRTALDLSGCFPTLLSLLWLSLAFEAHLDSPGQLASTLSCLCLTTLLSQGFFLPLV